MKHLITVWCPNLSSATVEPHEIALQIILYSAGGQEEIEVHGTVPKHCPACDYEFTELERDGLHAEIGEEADKIVNEAYPGIYVRHLPREEAA